MKRGIVALTLGPTLVAWLGGCVADSGGGGILVMQNVHPATGCAPTATAAEPAIGHGTLDLLLPEGYLFIAQLRSRITATTGQEAEQTIITTGAKIDITFPGSELFSAADLEDLHASGLTHLKQLFSAPLAPNGGIADIGFDLIPVTLAQRIAAKADLTQPFRIEAVAKFTVEGDLGGQTVTSQPFTFPVTIGNNLSVHVAGSCPLPKDFGTPRPGYACNPAQDGTVDCCDKAGALVCPATVSTL